MNDSIFWADKPTNTGNIINETWFNLRVNNHKDTFKNKLHSIKIEDIVKDDFRIKLKKLIGMKTEDLERILRKS